MIYSYLQPPYQGAKRPGTPRIRLALGFFIGRKEETILKAQNKPMKVDEVEER